MTDGAWRFLRSQEADDTTNLADDPRIALLAGCVANQQRNAGFGLTIDIREAKCPACRAPGFNTGMGFWAHTCGAEYLASGETAEPCPEDCAP